MNDRESGDKSDCVLGIRQAVISRFSDFGLSVASGSEARGEATHLNQVGRLDTGPRKVEHDHHPWAGRWARSRRAHL